MYRVIVRRFDNTVPKALVVVARVGAFKAYLFYDAVPCRGDHFTTVKKTLRMEVLPPCTYALPQVRHVLGPYTILCDSTKAATRSLQRRTKSVIFFFFLK